VPTTLVDETTKIKSSNRRRNQRTESVRANAGDEGANAAADAAKEARTTRLENFMVVVVAAATSSYWNGREER